MRPRQIIAVVHRGRSDAPTALDALTRWCRSRDVALATLDLEATTLPIEPDDETLALSMGGDGTFLRTAQLVADADVPVLGINLGSLGFLTQTGTGAIANALDQVWNGQFTIEPRLRLQAAVGDQTMSALNDVVISRPDVDTTTAVDLYRDLETFIGRYPGDGLILCTPSGSTAYGLAAGGPIVDPALACIAVTPLNAHRMSLRPLVLPPDVRLTARMGRPGWLVLDGEKRVHLDADEEIHIHRAPADTQMIVLGDRPGFFELLAKKLGWSWSHPDNG